MLDQGTRTAILRLAEEGHGTRRIAKALGVSRGAVRDVLHTASAEVPRIIRAEKAEPFREEILVLLASCKGNLVRVHEELLARGAELSYQALTAFCRRHGIGHAPKVPAGHYDFPPGKEMQHDTSPHRARLGGKWRPVQTASLVFCFSRMLFFQFYPRFSRFECKLFLTDAVEYFGGVCARCMIDNTHVVVLRGTGAQMVPVPEMAAFAERLHFSFVAHEKGDANRSARVEGPFDFIDNNFLAGREFADWEDINHQARLWCDKVNATFSRKLHASRRELFAAERPHLRPLPDWLPPPYVLHQRLVDLEGYVTVRTNRYSVPPALIGRRVEARETKSSIEIYDGPRLVASHARLVDPCGARVTDPRHRPPRGEAGKTTPKSDLPPEQGELLLLEPSLEGYVVELRRRSAGRGTLALRRLLALVRDYPRDPLLAAVRVAAHYGLYDLDRLERLILRHIARDFFNLPPPPGPEPEDPDER